MRRDDETQHLRILRPGECAPKSDKEVLEDVCRMVEGALHARAAMIEDEVEGVEYDLGQVMERIVRDGLEADVSAIRVGSFFSVFTEFKLLQRIWKAIKSRVEENGPQSDDLGPEEG